MQVQSVKTIVRRFNEAGVRYLVVGGLAVTSHGYVRFTADMDLVLDLENENNVLLALEVLKSEGYTPRISSPMEQFADRETREMWHNQRNLLVFSLWSNLHRQTEIDIFVVNPFDFDEAFERSIVNEDADGNQMRVVSLDDLLQMKKEAGRPKDLIDIEYLTRLRGGHQ